MTNVSIIRVPTSLPSAVRSLITHRELLVGLVRRDVAGRYRGAVLGLIWSFAYPLLLLAVFTVVFSVIFPAKWSTGVTGTGEFALVLFPGILIHAFLAECINRAPGLIPSVPNYVRKVVFPLEVLPVVTVLAALFHLLVGLAILVSVQLVWRAILPVTILALPLVLLPYIVLTLGISWLLTALGAYLRDIAQVTGVLTTVLMFLSPVFYPSSSLPLSWRWALQINPLTLPIEQTRAVLVFGVWPDWRGIVIYSVIAFLIAWGGYWWFQKTRRGFADVI